MADRSVSIHLRANVAPFTAGLRAAGKSTQDLSRNMTETGASADRMRRRLEAATRALPKIQIDADSSAAEVKFAQLRADLESLSDKKIGVDVSAADARAQLAEIERELENLQRNEGSIDVRADIGTALAELRAVDAEVSRVDGRTARVQVDADVGGAVAGIAMVGAALASLPAVTTIGVGVTALGGAFAAAAAGAGAFTAVAVPGFKRVSEALKEQETAARSAGGATGGAGQSAAQAAQQALQLEQAENRLKDAQADAKQAQEDLTRAREAGRRALEDMNFSLDRSILSEKDAALAVKEAAEHLAKVNADAKSSDLDRERAALDYEMALQRAEEQEVKTARARRDTAEANRAGVKGTREYQRAQEDLRQAQDKVAQAETQLRMLHLQQQAAMSSGGGAASGMKDALAGLSKQERELAKDLKAFSGAYLEWQRSLQPDVFPVISQGLGLMERSLPKLTPFAKSGSAAFRVLLDDAEAALAGPFWTQFLYNLNTAAPGAIVGFGRTAGNVFTGAAGVLDAFLPHTDAVVSSAEEMSAAFAEWGKNLKGNPEFEAFLAYVSVQGPKVAEVLGNIAAFAGKLVQAGAGPGGATLDLLVNISRTLAGMDPAQIQAIATGVGILFAAVRLGATLKLGGLLLLAELLAKMSPGQIQAVAVAIGAVVVATKGYQTFQAFSGVLSGWRENVTRAADTASKAKPKLAGIGESLGAASGVLAATSALGMLDQQLNGLNPNLNKMQTELGELGRSGQLTGSLAEQWGKSLGNAAHDVSVFGASLGEATESQESFRAAVSRLANPGPLESFKTGYLGLLNTLTLGTTELDDSKEKMAAMDQALAAMVTSGNPQQAQAAFAKLAQEAKAMGVPVENLSGLFPSYSQAVRDAGAASAGAAGGFDEAKQRLDGFQTSLDSFAGKTGALQAVRALEAAYKDVKRALEESNGKLEINSRMTDVQKEAVIRARESFSGYLQRVQEAVEGQKKFGSNVFDSTKLILEQLPKLGQLAGSNREAKEQVLALAAAYGISRADALKAMKGADDLREVIAKLKSKILHIDADTSKADEAIGRIIKTLSKTYVIGVDVRSDLQEHGNQRTTSKTKRAQGGVFAEDGTQYMARGGVRKGKAGRRRPAARIASSPTLIAGSGAQDDVIYGEAGTEAYIPLSRSKQARGRQVLTVAAGMLGLDVVSSDDRIDTDDVDGNRLVSVDPRTEAAGRSYRPYTGGKGSKGTKPARGQTATPSKKKTKKTPKTTTKAAGAWAGAAIGFARGQIGKPYKWGGTGPDSYDCSGLTMRSLQAAGIRPPRTSQQQMGWVRRVRTPVAGALGFPHAGHVWLYSGPRTIIEAARTGTNIREVAARTASVIGVPPVRYDTGGILPTGMSLVRNATGRPERILTDEQWRTLSGAVRNTARVSAPAPSSGYPAANTSATSAAMTGLRQVSAQLAAVVDRLDSVERRTPVNVDTMVVREESDVDLVSTRLSARIGARG